MNVTITPVAPYAETRRKRRSRKIVEEASLVQTSRFLTASHPQGPQLQIKNIPIIASFLGLEEAVSSPQGTLLRQRSETGSVSKQYGEQTQLYRDRELQRQ